MIKKVQAEILSKKFIATDTVELMLQNDYISEHAKPGQFLHIAVTNFTLRRPISIASVNKSEQTVTILFKIIGKGTDRLAQYEQGEYLDVLGPNGNPFPLKQLKEQDTVLLIGGGIGVPPIYFLATELAKRGVIVQAILGFQSKEYVFYEEAFEKMGKTIIVTNDGSYGKKGLVTDYIGEVAPFENYYSCGPLPMLKAVAYAIPNKKGYLSFEERMACGVGACYACVIPTNTADKYKKICQDGPVFAANEVIL